MRALVLASLLLAATPSALAVCNERGCAEAWSEDEGSCSAGGVERNVVRASTTTFEVPLDVPTLMFTFTPAEPVAPASRPPHRESVGASDVAVETYCHAHERGDRREVRASWSTDPRVQEGTTTLLWSWDEHEGCRLDMETRAPDSEPDLRAFGCPMGLAPPRVQPLLA